MNPWPRAIAHVDLDQFYAAVEILDFPELKGKPLIVGGSPDKRGVVSTASYEARKFGVHSAMPSVTAAKLCPQAVWRKPRMSRYVELSGEIRKVFERYTDRIEPLSLDEAFLDLSGSQRLFGRPEEIARRIKGEILAETKLVASVGVAMNKYLAKVASDLRKPDALVVVPYGFEEARAFLAPLPVKRLWGAGPKTCARLEALGLAKIADLQRADPQWLAARLGQGAAEHLRGLALGLDEREVETGERPKSVGRENTFAEDLREPRAMERELLGFADDIAARLRAKGLKALGVTLKVRLGDFTTFTRSHAFEEPTDLTEPLHQAGVEMLRARVDLRGKGVRLLGLQAMRLVAPEEWTEGLFRDEAGERRKRAAETVDRLRARFGSGAVTRGRLLEDKAEDTGSLNESPPGLKD
ncbi:MAG: DNA polymerase IV [Planctomycetota bacterium]|nr:DNA polymerase IV [Planctomycetota bacterium]